MDLVRKVIVVAHQESRVFLGALVPRDQQVLRDLPALKDPWDHEDIKATMANQEAKAPKAPKAPRDLKGPQDQWVHKESKVTQVRKEAKANQAHRDP